MVEGVSYDFWYSIFSVSVIALIYRCAILADVAVESVFKVWNSSSNLWRRTGLFCVKDGFRWDKGCMGVYGIHDFLVARKC